MAQYVNTKTGEVFDDATIFTKKQEEYLKNERGEALAKNKFVKSYGNFAFTIFSDIYEDIKDADIARLMYIATYINYDNIFVMPNGNPMTKHDMLDIISVRKHSFYDFYDAMIEKNIFMEETDCIRMNEKYFNRGTITKKDPYIRLFFNSVRALYEQNIGQKQDSLAYVFRLLPFMNYMRPILCANPNEPNPEKIRPLTLWDIGTLMGLQRVRPVELKKFLSQFRLANGDFVFAFVNNTPDITDDKIFYNPRVAFSGSKEDITEAEEEFLKNTDIMFKQYGKPTGKRIPYAKRQKPVPIR